MLIGVQLDAVWNDKQASQHRVLSLLQPLDISSGSLIVLPEMFATGYMMDVASACEENGPASEGFMRDLACSTGSFVLGGTVNRTLAGRGRNEAVLFEPDGRDAGRYQKIRPFSFAGETNFYEAGHELFLFDWQGFRAAPFICYDLRFPELFRDAARAGAQLFIVIANWPSARVDHWVTLLKARAIENQACVIGVNRCGSDPNLTYPGRSLIIDPRGQVLSDAGRNPGVICAELDLDDLLRYRAEFPVLKDAGFEDS